MEVNGNVIRVTNDKELLDVNWIHKYLHDESYWAKGIPLTTLTTSIKNSLCFALLYNEKQIGFARVITDYSVFAYLADVFIDQQFRGNGYSKLLIKAICDHPELQGLRKWLLM